MCALLWINGQLYQTRKRLLDERWKIYKLPKTLKTTMTSTENIHRHNIYCRYTMLRKNTRILTQNSLDWHNQENVKKNLNITFKVEIGSVAQKNLSWGHLSQLCQLEESTADAFLKHLWLGHVHQNLLQRVQQRCSERWQWVRVSECNSFLPGLQHTHSHT